MSLFLPPSAATAADQTYDVVICGGGLAGATLARQLKLHYADASVLVLDRQSYPVPEAAYKVGESSVEIAGFYFAESLQLAAYMDRAHLRKHGLRYFWNSHEPRFCDRPEVGLSDYTPCPSYQIDRGILENDLFRMNVEAGVDVQQQAQVEDIHLGEGDRWHEVTYLDAASQPRRVRGRWVIDAMGRRKYLQKKLGLEKDIPERFNAVWLRVKGRLDVADFVPESETEWHSRIVGRRRYYSTTHMMGKGYWVWLIPLGSGNTSVGIVTDEKFHDFETMDTLEKSFGWLAAHEPVVLEHLRTREFMDFMGVRNYNYSSTQALSVDRWACIGEAAAFSDPFYSPGSNMIGYENSIVTHLVGEDRAGRLSASRVKFFNEFVLSQNDWLDYNIHTAYSYFGSPMVMSMGFLWDTAVGWGIATPQMFNSIYLDEECTAAVRAVTSGFYPLALKVKQLLIDWEARSLGRFTFRFIDYYEIPFIKKIYARSLVKTKTREQLVADQQYSAERLEEFAQAIFLMAVADTMPELLPMVEGRWLNAWAIGFDPSRWERDGLFAPTTPARSLEPILGEVRRLYTPVQKTTRVAPPPRSVHIDLAF